MILQNMNAVHSNIAMFEISKFSPSGCNGLASWIKKNS